MAGATIKDVAKRAGVGLGTVSRVLNNHPQVSASTRERVLEAISDLNFRPNSIARRLPRKTNLRYVGVVCHPFVLNYHSIAERLRGIQTALKTFGDDDIEVVLFSVSSPQHYDAQLANIVKNGDVMGLIIIDLDLTSAQENALNTAKIPFVGLNNFPRRWARIGTNDQEGAYLLTKHLLSLGHRRIAYIGDNLFDEYGFPTSQARYTGYVNALNEHGLAVNSRYIKLGEHSYKTACQMTRELMSLVQPPTAIFAMSDLQAGGALKAAREIGLYVPTELSIAGYDDTEMSLLMGLTTVHQHLEFGGRLAVEHLLSLIARQETPPPQLPSAEVIIRLTTAPPSR